MKFFTLILLFITCCLPVYSKDVNGKALLQEGKKELESGRYEDAIASLSKAEKEIPLLGDYALLWLSDAYHETANHEESLKTLRTLLKRYPDSPLIKRVRIREIKEAEEVSEENIQKMYESFIKDYPDNTEMKYLYAMWLKKKDKKDAAKPIFKEIYIDTNSFSEMAYNELAPSDISVEDLMTKASNLMDVYDFSGAESILRTAMDKDDETFKVEILKRIGRCLFKQKNYEKSAKVFQEAKDIYWQVRSLYRSGEKEAFNSALDELIRSRDKRAGYILISVASDQRRDGKIEEAIKMYRNVVEKYPSKTEYALWEIAWTYFLTGEYKKAADLFTTLDKDYHKKKYLYWKARSLEASGENALDIYSKIVGRGRDFYSTMSYARIRRSSDFNNHERQNLLEIKSPIKRRPVTSHKNDRVETLIELGFSKEALSELVYISKHLDSMEDLVYVCSKFQQLGQYEYSVRLAVKIPYMKELIFFQYPFAYQETVEDLSEKYKLDPLLVFSVAREESRFDPEARSIAGALGLMQIMPHTAYKINNRLKLGIHCSHDILDVTKNLHLGIYYLTNLIDKLGSYSYALAAYNAGEEKVEQWLQRGNYKSADEFIEDIPYPETRNYVKKVLTTFFEYKKITSKEDGAAEISLEKL
jgi:soluble lytic murein transglycosylase